MKLIISDLTFSYSDKNIFEHTSIDFDFDKTYLLFGENGSGKSTFLKILMNHLLPKNGNIVFPSGMSTRDISIQLQEIRAFKNLRVKELERFWSEINEDTLDTYQHLRLNLGVHKIENQLIKNLSGGENRILIVYLTIILNKKIVILDEPFAGLDEEKKKALIEYISSAKIGKLFLIVSHEIVGFEKLFENYLYIDNYQIKKAESFEDIVRKKYYDK